MLAPVLSRLSGDPQAGAGLARLGLLATRDDVAPPPLARMAAEDACRIGAAGCGALAELVERPQLLEAHVVALCSDDADRSEAAMLAALTARAKVEAAPTPQQALAWLTPEELAALLADPTLLACWTAGMPVPGRQERLVAV